MASQKAAPLVVRVIDDRENMRARKKDPPLAASLLRGILSARGLSRGDCSGGCHGFPESPNPSDSTANRGETDFV